MASDEESREVGGRRAVSANARWLNMSLDDMLEQDEIGEEIDAMQDTAKTPRSRAAARKEHGRDRGRRTGRGGKGAFWRGRGAARAESPTSEKINSSLDDVIALASKDMPWAKTCGSGEFSSEKRASSWREGGEQWTSFASRGRDNAWEQHRVVSTEVLSRRPNFWSADTGWVYKTDGARKDLEDGSRHDLSNAWKREQGLGPQSLPPPVGLGWSIAASPRRFQSCTAREGQSGSKLIQEIEGFAKENGLDQKCTKVLFAQSLDVQRHVLGEGRITGTNFSAVLMSRIRRAKVIALESGRSCEWGRAEDAWMAIRDATDRWPSERKNDACQERGRQYSMNGGSSSSARWRSRSDRGWGAPGALAPPPPPPRQDAGVQTSFSSPPQGESWSRSVPSRGRKPVVSTVIPLDGSEDARSWSPAPLPERRLPAARRGARVKVTNVPRGLPVADIRNAFEDKAGQVVDCSLRNDVAWVTFAYLEDATKAVDLFDGGELNGNIITVTIDT